MNMEARRALGILYALNRSTENPPLGALLQWAQCSPQNYSVDASGCHALAHALKEKGAPLTDDGIRRFRIERGFSGDIRIDPAIAAAYARFAHGIEAKLHIDAAQWRCLNLNQRRVLNALLTIGRKPNELASVLQKLGVRPSPNAPKGVLWVGAIAARRLSQWLANFGLSLDDAGLLHIEEVLGVLRHTHNGRLAISNLVADTVLAKYEPVHDYARCTYQGQTVNQRTASMLRLADRLLPQEHRFELIQGSYCTPARQGAHPHLGGGTVDLVVANDPQHMFAIQGVLALRQVGFAAWLRKRASNTHIHAVAIGDLEMSPAADWQVGAFFAGKDGRTGQSVDPHADQMRQIRPPLWTLKYRIRYACNAVNRKH